MKINKETNIFCSFSADAGNNGCLYFNKEFKKGKINALYKSFSIKNIKDAVFSARVLKFKGFGVSMPFKKEIINFLDEIDIDAKKIGAVNTVINSNGVFKGYNTDFLAIKEILEKFNKKIIILGNGGFGMAAEYACRVLELDYDVIERKNIDLINWNKLTTKQNCIILNCTPADFSGKPISHFIDGRPHTKQGKQIALKQAAHQLELYKKSIL